MKISENTAISMPMKNMLAIIAGVAMGVFAYTEVTSRLTSLETSRELFQADLLKKSEQLPTDQEQFMLIEHLAGEFEKLQDEIDTGKAPHDQQQALTLQFFEKRISSLEERMERIRDAIASLKASNGGHDE